jgi:tetratricopeptide (TPR) repeat protein
MIRLGSIVALALLLAATLGAAADEAPRQPTLGPPGLSPIPLPPRSHGVSPGSEDAAPRSAKPDESAQDKPPAPRTRAELLNDLYARLAASKDADETSGLIGAIDRLELESGSDAGDLLMARAVAAMTAKNYDVALALLDKLIDLHPEWAEAWNKRATVRFLVDDDRGSMADIAHVLKLEPRHIGALAGMGVILEREGFRDDALRAYQRALQIAPQLKSLKDSVERLTKAVQGEDL